MGVNTTIIPAQVDVDGKTIKNKDGEIYVNPELTGQIQLDLLSLQNNAGLDSTDYDYEQLDIMSDSDGSEDTVDTVNTTMFFDTDKYKNWEFVELTGEGDTTSTSYTLLFTESSLNLLTDKVWLDVRTQYDAKDAWAYVKFTYTDDTTANSNVVYTQENSFTTFEMTNPNPSKTIKTMSAYGKRGTVSGSNRCYCDNLSYQDTPQELELHINPEETINPSATALYVEYSDGSFGEVEYSLVDSVAETSDLTTNTKNEYTLSNAITKIKLKTGTDLTEIKAYVFSWWE